MSFNLDIYGLDGAVDEMERIALEAPAAVERTMNFLARSTAQRARAKIRTPGRTGRVYNYSTGPHQASAPGEPPANLSGALAASITHTESSSKKDVLATAGTNLPYGETLEFGGVVRGLYGFVYVAPRPWLQPSFDEAITQAAKTLRKEFESRL